MLDSQGEYGAMSEMKNSLIDDDCNTTPCRSASENADRASVEQVIQLHDSIEKVIRRIVLTGKPLESCLMQSVQIGQHYPSSEVSLDFHLVHRLMLSNVPVLTAHDEFWSVCVLLSGP